MKTMIRFDGVSKQYRRGTHQASLRDAFDSLMKRLLGRHQGESNPSDRLWAVNDVSFRVEQSEVLGIIGPNGAGKTTALKLLSRVTRPTSGTIEVNGRLSSLIELGAGFHPDLTGRENIFLNGVILGLSRAEIANKFDDIVAFSGLKDFIDTPVKRYSSGMYVRLGFAVAAHVDPEVLLVDEVLAVGDHQFRVKCTERFRELKNQGVTTVVVSHNRHMIEHLCSRTIYLRDGRIVYDGDSSEAWDRYLADAAHNRYGLGENPDETAADHRKQILITDVEVLDRHGEPKAVFHPGEPAQARIAFAVQDRVEDPVFYARLYRDGDLVHGTNSARHDIAGTYRPGDQGVATIDYRALPFLDGTYALHLGIEKSFSSRAAYDRAPTLSITVAGGLAYGTGKVYVDHDWRVRRTEDDGAR